jgi:hypothetical protein
MRKALNRRVAAAEQAAISKAPAFRIIRVQGGLPGPVRCAQMDGVHCQRLPDESVEIFETRVIAAAESAKSKSVIFGGLCGCGWKEPGSFDAYLKGRDFQLIDENEIAIEQREDQ